MLYQGASLNSWAVVSFASNTEDLLKGRYGLMGFIDDLRKMMRGMGLTVSNQFPPFVDAERMRPRQALDKAATIAQNTFRAPADLIMVLLPNKESSRYKEIKYVATGELGVMTQCFVTTSAGIGTG